MWHFQREINQSSCFRAARMRNHLLIREQLVAIRMESMSGAFSLFYGCGAWDRRDHLGRFDALGNGKAEASQLYKEKQHGAYGEVCEKRQEGGEIERKRCSGDEPLRKLAFAAMYYTVYFYGYLSITWAHSFKVTSSNSHKSGQRALCKWTFCCQTSIMHFCTQPLTGGRSGETQQNGRDLIKTNVEFVSTLWNPSYWKYGNLIQLRYTGKRGCAKIIVWKKW